MAKTGTDDELGTAEGALLGRAAHALHAENPVLDDTWAVHLLAPESQRLVRDPEHYRQAHAPGRSVFAPILAVGVGCLRLAEDEVLRCVAHGVGQYVVLGAGFDTFALRRGDLNGRLRVFEVDHPDVQALKRERIGRAEAKPAMLPDFVSVDFETTALGAGLRASRFDPKAPAVWSWMNTTPYLTKEATERTLGEIAQLAAPGSRLIVNYAAAVAFSEAQRTLLTELLAATEERREPLRSRWEPGAFSALIAECGFDIVDHATEDDLYERYFAQRTDGLAPGPPTRVVTAERRGD